MKKNIMQISLLLVAVLFIGLILGIFISRLNYGSIPLSTYDADPDYQDIAQEETQAYRDSLGKINVNHASAAELEMLPGVGKTTAERIVAYRQKFGPFYNIDDLTKVKGIGAATLDKFRQYVTVGG